MLGISVVVMAILSSAVVPKLLGGGVQGFAVPTNLGLLILGQ